jgi:hypothetical protein
LPKAERQGWYKMKVEKIDLIKSLNKDGVKECAVYWNINLPEVRLAINVFRKKHSTLEKAEKLVKYIVSSLENYE